MDEVVDFLIKNKKTIATMESCTGGALVNEITNVEGASEVLKFSAVTYSNEFKIKFGVDSDIIDKYSVYSMNTAIEMSTNIVKFTHADYGVGITGKLNRVDINNLVGENNKIFVSIYDFNKNKYYNFEIISDLKSRKENKNKIVEEVKKVLLIIFRNS